MNSSSEGSTASTGGARSTIDSVMPVSTVIERGMAMPGLTRVWKVPSGSPPRTLTAPISVIAHVRRVAAGGLEVEHAERDLGERRAEVVEACADRTTGQRTFGQ